MSFTSLSLVIPTYLRESVLLDTINFILRLEIGPADVIIVDQTREHSQDVLTSLEKLSKEGMIRWIRLKYPSIPKAMNTGLLHASHEIVLFLDDDIIPNQNLVATHVYSHNNTDADLVAGRVIQPWDPDFMLEGCRAFSFSMKCKHWTDEFIGCNFSVRRSTALKIGGFDENFVKVAYRFERDFADRLISEGGKILFEPNAVIKHLKLPHGGTRSYGDHLRTFKPNHAVGEYYYLLRANRIRKNLPNILRRPLRSIITNHHLHRPWWIPITLSAEILGLFWAIFLAMRGPRFLGWDQQL